LAQANAAAPPPPPPPDYAAILGGAAAGLREVFGGINTAIQNGENNRLRELELNYRNQANAGTLALQQRQLEIQQQIVQLQRTPTADPNLVSALQQQSAQYREQIANTASSSTGMSTTATVGLVVGGLAVAGGAAYLLLGKKGRR